MVEICEFLDSIIGTGEFSAVLIRYEIDDIERFSSVAFSYWHRV
jgi:hypothetical protein